MGVSGDTLTAISRLSNRRRVKGANEEEEGPYIPGAPGAIVEEGPGIDPVEAFPVQDFPAEPLPPEGMLPPPMPSQTSDARANQILPDTSQQEEIPQPPTSLSDLGQNLANITGQGGRPTTVGDQPDPQYGLRQDYTPKGEGYFGPMQAEDGKAMTEKGIGVGFDGQETQIPSIVPTLSYEEIEHLKQGGETTPEIANKAVEHARQRIQQGESPFASPEEEGQTPMPEAPEAPAETPGGFFSAIGDYFSPTKRKETGEEVESIQRSLQEAQQQGLGVQEYQKKVAEEYGPQQGATKAEVDEAMKTPYTKTVYGSTNRVMNTPELKDQLSEIGVEVNPEEEAMTNNMEVALSEEKDEVLKAKGLYNEEVSGIRTRIKENKATDKDKYLIGLALLMPLIIGGFFGTEAGIQSLAGSAKGLSEVYEKRTKGIREDEKRLTELGQLQGKSDIELKKLAVEKTKIPAAVKKAIGDGPLAHLKGATMVTYTDEKGKKVEGPDIFSPNFIPQLKYVRTKEGVKRMGKKETDLIKAQGQYKDAERYLTRMVNIAKQIEDPAWYNVLFARSFTKLAPGTASKIGPKIMLDGREVSAGAALQETLEKMGQQRRAIEGIKAFSPLLFKHLEKIYSNPFTDFNDPQTLIDQTLRSLDDGMDSFIEDTGDAGFLEQPLIKEFKKRTEKLYKDLNLRENLKKTKKREAGLSDKKAVLRG